MPAKSSNGTHGTAQTKSEIALNTPTPETADVEVLDAPDTRIARQDPDRVVCKLDLGTGSHDLTVKEAGKAAVSVAKSLMKRNAESAYLLKAINRMATSVMEVATLPIAIVMIKIQARDGGDLPKVADGAQWIL